MAKYEIALHSLFNVSIYNVIQKTMFNINKYGCTFLCTSHKQVYDKSAFIKRRCTRCCLRRQTTQELDRYSARAFAKSLLLWDKGSKRIINASGNADAPSKAATKERAGSLSDGRQSGSSCRYGSKRRLGTDAFGQPIRWRLVLRLPRQDRWLIPFKSIFRNKLVKIFEFVVLRFIIEPDQ